MVPVTTTLLVRAAYLAHHRHAANHGLRHFAVKFGSLKFYAAAVPFRHWQRSGTVRPADPRNPQRLRRDDRAVHHDQWPTRSEVETWLQLPWNRGVASQ